MTYESFAEMLKKMRESRGISSRALSAKVNKYHAYVSQIENGRIKNPDFESAKALLKELNVKDDIIDDILRHFDILSPVEEKARDEQYQKEAEESFEWMEFKAEHLKSKNKKLYTLLNSFVDRDLSRAEQVVNNILSLCVDEEKFNFFCSLFEHNHALIDREDRNHIITLINDYIFSKYEFDDYGEFVPKE